MATALKPIGHEDRLTLVEHLDELRTRIIICVVTFSVAFGLCLWQSDRILHVMNRPLETCDPIQEELQGPVRAEREVRRDPEGDRAALAGVRPGGGGEEAVSPATRAAAQDMARAAGTVVRAAPAVTGRRPVTLGVGEPFTATVKVAAYAALLISLPILLYQAYAFVLPAFSPRERQVAVPMMLMIPFLFIAGVVFAYYMVLPNAIRFLQNFNDDIVRHPPAGARLLQLLDHGPGGHGAAVPGADRDPRGHARGDRHDAPAAQEPPLRDPRDRRRRDAAARPGPGHDALADGAR